MGIGGDDTFLQQPSVFVSFWLDATTETSVHETYNNSSCEGNDVGSLRSCSKIRCDRFLYGLGEYPELLREGEEGVLDEVPTDERERCTSPVFLPLPPKRVLSQLGVAMFLFVLLLQLL